MSIEGGFSMAMVCCPICGWDMSDESEIVCCLQCAHPFDAAVWRIASRGKQAEHGQMRRARGGLLTACRSATWGMRRDPLSRLPNRNDRSENGGISRAVADRWYRRWRCRSRNVRAAIKN